MKFKLTWTKVLNGTGLLVLFVCMWRGATYSDATVGAIAMLLWSVLNLFTEGGIHTGKISRTVIVNGLGALASVLTASHLIPAMSTAQSAQMQMLVITFLNMFTEGGVTDDNAPPPSVSGMLGGLVVTALLSTALLTGCASTMAGLPTPDKILTADQANAALVKAEAIRVLARDAVAEAYNDGVIDNKAVADFAVFDKTFTQFYHRARIAIEAGQLDSFRAVYAELREAALKVAGSAASAAPNTGTVKP